MDQTILTIQINDGSNILLRNHDNETIEFYYTKNGITNVPFIMHWKQPKEIKDFLLEILTDLDNGVSDESEIYMMSLDLDGVKTSVGELAPMNIITIYREQNDMYSCYYGCSTKNTYQSFTIAKSGMSDFIKSLLKAINDKGIKREIFL